MRRAVLGFFGGSVLILLAFGTPLSLHPVLPQNIFSVSPGSSQRVFADDHRQLLAWDSFLDQEIGRGELVARPPHIGPGGTVHQRLDQFYQGLPVWGGQVIRHYRGAHLFLVNGRYYPDIQIGAQANLTSDEATDIARASLEDTPLSLLRDPTLIVLPVEAGYALAYQILLGRRGKALLSLVDATTGTILLQYDDLRTEAVIGQGTGVHGDTKKISADSYDSSFRSWDKMRPAVTKTYDFLTDFYAWSYYTYTDADLGSDGDNNWTDSTQYPIVDGHDYTGWTYDYYYVALNRRGFDDFNGLLKVNVNFDIWGINNAFYDSYDNSLNFYSGDQVTYTYFAGALDVVAHEYSHAVTRYTCDLNYYSYSGALDEAFSDFVAACAEFYHQPEGSGFLKADWLMGEDTLKVYNENKVIRRLDKPYLLKAWGTFPYPDHWSNRYTGSSDGGGVHVNSTIASHWFYLLTVGGTNRVSGITVTGIGREKAEKIAYHGWTDYLFPSADFQDAYLACHAAAVSLYGGGGPEVEAVDTAWHAVGIY